MPTLEDRISKLEDAKDASVREILKKLGKLGLTSALTLAVIAALVLYWSTNKAIDSANTSVTELLKKTGSLEERASNLQKSVEKLDSESKEVDAVVQRLRSKTPNSVNEILDLLDKSEVRDLLATGEIERRLTKLSSQVAASELRIETAVVPTVTDKSEGWLETPGGPPGCREMIMTVEFPGNTPFTEVPRVAVSIQSLLQATGKNIGASVHVVDGSVTKASFKIRYFVWNTGGIEQITASYIAWAKR